MVVGWFLDTTGFIVQVLVAVSMSVAGWRLHRYLAAKKLARMIRGDKARFLDATGDPTGKTGTSFDGFGAPDEEGGFGNSSGGGGGGSGGRGASGSW